MDINIDIVPPVARRDKDRVVYAGVAPPGWNLDIPRQAETSIEPSMDPAIAIPDPYGWIRDDSRQNKEVWEYLQQENKYTTACTQHLGDLRTALKEEYLWHNSFEEEEYTLPLRGGGDWYYYTRTYPHQAYRIHCRAPTVSNRSLAELLSEQSSRRHDHKNDTSTSMILPREQVLLDENILAKETGATYFAIHSVVPSPSHNQLVYSVDTTGDETYDLFLSNLDDNNNNSTRNQTCTRLKTNMSGSVVWGMDDSCLYFLVPDAIQRPYQLVEYHLEAGTEMKRETVLWQEPNPAYWCELSKSLDHEYLIVNTGTSETTETWTLRLTLDHQKAAANAAAAACNTSKIRGRLQCLLPRPPNVCYTVEHRLGYWWIVSNHVEQGGAVGAATATAGGEMQLWTAPVKSPSNWSPVSFPNGTRLFDSFRGGDGDQQHSIPPSMDRVVVLDKHLVIEGRQDGLPRIWIAQLSTEDDVTIESVERLEFLEAAHHVSLETPYDYHGTETIVVSYQSLVTPPQSMEISLDHPFHSTILKELNVPGYDPTLYGCDRIEVPSRDGYTRIPISIVYRKDTLKQLPCPVHLFGYGSYGHSLEAAFSSIRLPLLNRGMIWVTAHVRGGGELGRPWYESAKFQSKHLSFDDFCDVAQWLVDHGWTTPDILSCEGRSAGGLLVGASINQAPQLFRTALLGVPFLDVLCTMVDASLPLSMIEWDEWGNPNEKIHFDSIQRYCPMNNVMPGTKYPSCLLIGGWNDPRVPYWDPVKFAATLRHTTAYDESRPVCVRLDMGAGHSYGSDRVKYYEEMAYMYSFVIDQVGLD
jgi:oligopeptidase B